MGDTAPSRATATRWESPNPSADDTPGPEPDHLQGPRKRLRVRKGTKSCWECKRRKIRCTFAASADILCNGCSRRGTACVSQEFPDEPAVRTSNGNNRQTGEGDRLGRVEALVELLIRNPGTNDLDRDIAGNNNGPKDPSGVRLEQRAASRNIHTSHTNIPSETSTGISPPPVTERAARPAVEVTSKHNELSRTLRAAWPSSHELEMILSEPLPVGMSFTGVLHKIDFISRSAFDDDSPLQPELPVTTPREMLQLPPAGSHPVLIARRLLLLGVYLQSLRPTDNHQRIMSRVIETAVSLVATNDELTGSLEGIECITLESLYHDNVGNLRRAWLAIRRAVAVAQMMGLHRGDTGNMSLLKILEPETRTRIDPEYMWFRLVQSDRYFSLMLGLPHSSPESVFATPQILERCTPVERMRRLNSVAAERILQRNHEDNGDGLATTHEIDQLLQKSSANMPSQWWLSGGEARIYTPSPEDEVDAGKRMLQETARITDQLAHYQLLVQLHLPYLLRSPAQRKYDYSKMTAVHASRELLRRFLAFRAISPVGSYCRGFDFNAFIATSTLCLAHMEARRHARAEGAAQGGSVLDFLAHQRSADRGMMERAVECLNRMAVESADALAERVALILQQLLVIEADAAAGGRYSANSSPAEAHLHGQAFGCHSGLIEGGNVLRIVIPFFGTVKIERGGVDTSVLSMVPPTSGGQNECGSGLDAHGAAARSNDLFDFSRQNGTQDAQFFVPELAAGVDDWALQGVDMAFFDNLMRGTETDAAAGGSWSSWDGVGPLVQ